MSNVLYGSNGFVSSLPIQSLSRLVKLLKKDLWAIFGSGRIHAASLFLRFNEDNVHDKNVEKAVCISLADPE